MGLQSLECARVRSWENHECHLDVDCMHERPEDSVSGLFLAGDVESGGVGLVAESTLKVDERGMMRKARETACRMSSLGGLCSGKTQT